MFNVTSNAIGLLLTERRNAFPFSRDLESSINGLTPPPAPFSLGNTSYLTQETTQDRQALYSQLVNSYKWIDKVHEYGSMATTMLSANALKRSYFNNSNKRRRPLTSCHNIPPMQVDNVISTIDRGFSDMNIRVWRPFATNVIVHVSESCQILHVHSLSTIQMTTNSR